MSVKQRTIWAECLWVDPISDLAILGSVDNQSLPEEAEAYEALVEPLKPAPIGPMEEKTKAWLFSLKGEWFECEAKYVPWLDGPITSLTRPNRSKAVCQDPQLLLKVEKQLALSQVTNISRD